MEAEVGQMTEGFLPTDLKAVAEKMAEAMTGNLFFKM